MTLSLAAFLSACVPSEHATTADPAAPHFDPLAFFASSLQGEGELKIILKPRRHVSVESHGRRDGDDLVLDQRVAMEGKPPTVRQWRIRQVSPGRYDGSLSDAAGPVTGETRGNLLHLAFAMKGGVQADQWLALSRDGRVARNVLIARKLGLTVARLDETIRRAD